MSNIYNHRTFRREKNETGGNKYFCNFCSNIYETYNGIKTHIRRHHALEKSGATGNQNKSSIQRPMWENDGTFSFP